MRLIPKMTDGARIRIAKTTDSLGDVLRADGERPGWELDFMGVPLIVYNVRKIRELLGRLDGVELPPELEGSAEVLRGEFGESKVHVLRDGIGSPNGAAAELPSNSLVVPDGGNGWTYETLAEPWSLVEAMCKALKREVKETIIAGSAEIAPTAVISGPCVISEGVKIDDFCKVKGPAYIGPGTKVWTGSLVRESMIGPDCEVGFGCEVARTYMLGRDRTAHHDVILDSVLGLDVWMGAFIGTTNKLLNNATVKYKVGEKLVDTGVNHFGAVFGYGSAVGAGTVILPGRFVPPRAIIQAGTVYSSPADVKQ
jgi:bifunctional UDP-N-acetylglucosamine pyrophosphorylase/glucosamine-1-phosphate N-acetyltransferase